MARGAAGSIGMTLGWWTVPPVGMGVDEGGHFPHNRDTNVGYVPFSWCGRGIVRETHPRDSPSK
jgi:hypothetical protein